MSMKVLFYARANGPIGGGHIGRCLTLLQAFQRLGLQCTFAYLQGSEQIVPALSGANCQKIVIPSELSWGDANHLRESCPFEPDLLVVDDYGLDFRFEGSCRGWAKTIAALDDIIANSDRRRHDVDLLSDETIGRVASAYQGWVPGHCQILAGAQFALVDLDYARLRERSLARRQANNGQIRRIVISMGLTDRFGYSAKILQAVAEADLDAAVDIVMGPTAPSLPQVEDLAQRLAPMTTVHTGFPVAAMADLMFNADLAIGAGGTTSWARCTLGLPTLIIPMARCQMEITRNLATAGAAIICLATYPQRSEDFDKAEIAEALARLNSDRGRLQTMSECAAAVTNGRGAMRVAVKMYNLARSAQSSQPESDQFRRLVVVCTGNYYRSRFVEKWFNHLATLRGLAWRAESRGLALWEGVDNFGPIDQEVVRYLKELNISVPETERMPLPLAEVDLAGASLILCLDEAKHRLLFTEQFPTYADDARLSFWEVSDIDQTPRQEALKKLADFTLDLVHQLQRQS